MSPTQRTITSASKRVQAVITPVAASGAHVTITENGKPGPSFTVGGMPVDVVVFDDGSLLTLDTWHKLGFDHVASVYGRDGKLRWSKTLVELLGAPLVDKAPRSVSSIWWRKTPLEWQLASDGASGLITLFDENQLRLTLADGTATVVSVAALPDDPQRLLNRARALAEDGQDAAAVVLLERAIAKNADFFDAYLVFAQTLQRSNDHARVVAAFERASPRWTVHDGYNVANVYVVWATSLSALSRDADAVRVLRLAVRAAPTYSNPTLALAAVMTKLRYTKDADRVLDEFVTQLAKEPYLDSYGVMAAGDFYKDRGEFAKALAHYLKAYKTTEVTNQFLYASIAEAYEKLNNDARAIAITEQLLAHFVKFGPAFAANADATRAELQRLRGKAKR